MADQDVLDLLFSDVNALLNVMNQLTDNYRLLVGAAEELTRTPGAGQRSINLALDRVDNTGTLIDMTIVTLFIKLQFVTEVLDVTGIPLTLIVELLEKIINDPEPRNPHNLLPRPRILEVAEELGPIDDLDTEITEEITDFTGRRPGRSGQRFVSQSHNSSPNSDANAQRTNPSQPKSLGSHAWVLEKLKSRKQGIEKKLEHKRKQMLNANKKLRDNS